MQFRPHVAVAATVLLLAACSSGGATTAGATTVPTAAPAAAPTAAPAASVEASAPPAAEAPCAPGAAGGEVQVTIADFAFDPADITATVGQTVSFTNSDSAPHTATLDEGSCTTPNLNQGASSGLTFGVAGTYPFHCNVHPSMKGTITVS